VLTHPMLDQLGQLACPARPRPLPNSKLPMKPLRLLMPTGSASCSIVSSPIATTSGLPPGCAMPDCATRPASRDVDYRAPRGLDRALFQKLTNGEWIDAHDNLILCGPTGVGKSWLGCALGHKACRDNRSVLYQRVPKLFAELALARGDGRYARILRGLTGVQLLILDDWGLEPLDAGARRDLYEILEERYGRRSTILTSQIPVDKWHAFIGDPTYADAILDRLVHNAHRIDLAGESLRRRRSRSIPRD
jgi:DNA replication protein DnaC